MIPISLKIEVQNFPLELKVCIKLSHLDTTWYYQMPNGVHAIWEGSSDNQVKLWNFIWSLGLSDSKVGLVGIDLGELCYESTQIPCALPNQFGVLFLQTLKFKRTKGNNELSDSNLQPAKEASAWLLKLAYSDESDDKFQLINGDLLFSAATQPLKLHLSDSQVLTKSKLEGSLKRQALGEFERQT